MVPLEAEKLILWVIPPDQSGPIAANQTQWPVEKVSLQEITSLTNQDKGFIVVLSDPAVIKEIQKSVKNGFYVQNGLVREIYFRPLWPQETHFGFYTDLPTPAPIVPPGTTLTCRPEDGTYPIP